MTAAPARRLVAVFGLVALGIIGYLLASGQLSVVKAGQRAAVTLAGVVLASRLAGWGFGLMVASLEGPAAGPEPEPVPLNRRRTDPAGEAAAPPSR